jgi:hypothetical protein
LERRTRHYRELNWRADRLDLSGGASTRLTGTIAPTRPAGTVAEFRGRLRGYRLLDGFLRPDARDSKVPASITARLALIALLAT